MTQYAYHPDTGELIRTTSPSDWMGLTDIVPPAFDSAVCGCFWRNGAWVIEYPQPDNSQRIREINARLTQIDIESVRPLRAKLAATAVAADEAKLVALETEASALRAELRSLSA
jgi:hypothetical protein